MKVILRRADSKGWRVSYGPLVVFIGKRPAAKRAAAQFCAENGLASWFNEKQGGKLVEINIRKP